MAGSLDSLLAGLSGNLKKLGAEQAAVLQAMTGSVGKAVGALTGGAARIGAAFGAVTPRVLAAVEAFSPFTTGMLTREVRNLSAAFGRLFVPAVEKATEVVRKLNEWVTNLPEPMKKLVTGFATAAAGLAVFGTLIPKLIGSFGILFTTISIGIKALTADFTALGVASGGILPAVGLLVAALGGAAFALSRTEEGAQLLAEVGGELKAVWEEVSAVFAEAWREFRPVLAELGGLLRRLAAGALELHRALRPMGEMVEDVFVTVLGAALDNLVTLADAVSRLAKALSQSLRPALQLAKEVAARLSQEFGALLEAMTPVFEFVMRVAVRAIERLIDGLTRTVLLVGVLTERIRESGALGLLDLSGILDEVNARFDALLSRSESLRRRAAAGGGRTFAAQAPSFVSAEDVGRRAQLAAAGAGKSAAERTADNSQRMADMMEQLVRQQREHGSATVRGVERVAAVGLKILRDVANLTDPSLVRRALLGY